MFTKLTLKMRTFYMTLETKDLIDKIFNDNFLIRDIAKEEFLKRDLSNLNIPDDVLNQIINKLSIEEIWNIVKENQDNHFTSLVIEKLNSIFEYYEKKYPNDYISKINEENKIFKLLK